MVQAAEAVARNCWAKILQARGGNGGAGIASSISGTLTTYAGGGGGGINNGGN
jgi:hypothetical protein